MSKNVSTLRMTQLALLIAIELIMTVTPLGYIMIPPIAATLMHIPVIVGAVVMGPKAGAALGTVFGKAKLFVGSHLPPMRQPIVEVTEDADIPAEIVIVTQNVGYRIERRRRLAHRHLSHHRLAGGVKRLRKCVQFLQRLFEPLALAGNRDLVGNAPTENRGVVFGL